MLSQTYIDSLVKRAGNKGKIRLKKQLRIIRSANRLPMNTTQSLLNSLKTEVNPSGFLYMLEIQGNDYGSFLDKGFTTPFAGVQNTPGNGGFKSDYIEGLIRWGMNKFGWNYKYAKKKAFAIAISNLRAGRTSPKSKGWVQEVKPKIDRDISQHLQENVLTAINNEINKVLNRKITTKI